MLEPLYGTLAELGVLSIARSSSSAKYRPLLGMAARRLKESTTNHH